MQVALPQPNFVGQLLSSADSGPNKHLATLLPLRHDATKIRQPVILAEHTTDVALDEIILRRAPCEIGALTLEEQAVTLGVTQLG